MMKCFKVPYNQGEKKLTVVEMIKFAASVKYENKEVNRRSCCSL